MDVVWWKGPAHAVLAVGLSVLILFSTGCHQETDRLAPKAAVAVGALAFRALELPFLYERGETGDGLACRDDRGWGGPARLRRRWPARSLLRARGPLLPGKVQHSSARPMCC